MAASRQLALIALLAANEGANGRLGKKAFQKFVHILTCLSDRSFGYKFSFYTYGAFSRELAADLDIAQSMNLVTIDYNSFDNAYSIRASNEANAIIEENFPEAEQLEIKSYWSKFSNKTARDLELYSTILFVTSEENVKVNSNAMTKRVEELKPKYDATEIKSSQQYLLNLVS